MSAFTHVLLYMLNMSKTLEFISREPSRFFDIVMLRCYLTLKVFISSGALLRILFYTFQMLSGLIIRSCTLTISDYFLNLDYYAHDGRLSPFKFITSVTDFYRHGTSCDTYRGETAPTLQSLLAHKDIPIGQTLTSVYHNSIY